MTAPSEFGVATEERAADLLAELDADPNTLAYEVTIESLRRNTDLLMDHAAPGPVARELRRRVAALALVRPDVAAFSKMDLVDGIVPSTMFETLAAGKWATVEFRFGPETAIFHIRDGVPVPFATLSEEWKEAILLTLEEWRVAYPELRALIGRGDTPEVITIQTSADRALIAPIRDETTGTVREC